MLNITFIANISDAGNNMLHVYEFQVFLKIITEIDKDVMNGTISSNSGIQHQETNIRGFRDTTGKRL